MKRRELWERSRPGLARRWRCRGERTASAHAEAAALAREAAIAEMVADCSCALPQDAAPAGASAHRDRNASSASDRRCASPA